MKKTRILQLHNLAIGPRPEENPFPALLNLFEEKRVDLLGHIDYLVVCGNFTRDRSSKSFRRARTVLRDMTRSFLANGGPPANRVFLVPGPGDVPNPHAAKPNFAAFRHFYEEFFRSELLQPDMHFDPDRAELRVLKDLTLIGLSYWRSPDKDVSAGRARTFKRALDGIVSSLSQVPLPYLSTTLTLLVSAGTPFFASDSTWLPADADLPGIINPNLRITYHLIADGPLPILPAVPFSIPHLSLALRADSVPDSLWPLHANLIEMEGDPLVVDERPGATLTVFRKGTSGAPWKDSRTEIAVPAPPVPPPPEKHVETLYGDFSRTLAGYLKKQPHLKMIHVQGFPGSGLVDVFTWLTTEPRRQIGDLMVGVNGHRWENASGLAAFLKELALDPDGSYHLIVLHDPTLEEGYNEEKKKHVEDIVEACTACLYGGYKLLYLTGVIGTNLSGLDSVVNDHNSAGLPLSALENFVGSEFLYSYACRMPLQSLQLDTLTGGYIGLSRRFLSACEQNFGNWSGAHCINEQSSTLLLDDSFRHPEVDRACSRFLESAKRCKSSQGKFDHLFDHLRKQVLDRFAAVGAGAPNLPDEVEVELKDLAQAGTLRSLLLNHKVLGHVDADRYRIRVVAPFLVRSEYRVFFSYHNEDRDYVERIRRQLELEAARQYSILTINAYSLDSRPPEIASYKHEDLVAALRESANLCVFLVEKRAPRPTTVKAEILDWKKARPSRHGESRLISVVPKFPAHLPKCLLDSNPIPINRLDDSQLASSLFRALVSSNKTWGFDVARPV